MILKRLGGTTKIAFTLFILPLAVWLYLSRILWQTVWMLRLMQVPVKAFPLSLTPLYYLTKTSPRSSRQQMRKWRKVKWYTPAATCDEQPAIKPPAYRRPSAAFSGPLSRKPEKAWNSFVAFFLFVCTKTKRKNVVETRRREEVPQPVIRRAKWLWVTGQLRTCEW